MAVGALCWSVPPRRGAQGRAPFQDPKKILLFGRLGSPRPGDPFPSPGRGLPAHPTVAARASLSSASHSPPCRSVCLCRQQGLHLFIPAGPPAREPTARPAPRSESRRLRPGALALVVPLPLPEKGLAGHRCGRSEAEQSLWDAPPRWWGGATLRVQGGQRPLVVPFTPTRSSRGGDSQPSVHALREGGGPVLDEGAVWAPLWLARCPPVLFVFNFFCCKIQRTQKRT